MLIEQFVMAYQAEQDRIRAILPDGFESLRPVLRINTEIRDECTAYVEFNTPVTYAGKRGWLNIAHWESPDISFRRDGKKVDITSAFLDLAYEGVGIEGSCPAEKDNEGCFFLGEPLLFQPAETISSNKEFCDCSFSWKFSAGDGHGQSIGKTLLALPKEKQHQYEVLPLTAENAAAIPCKQVLGSYIVRFERDASS